MVAYPAPTYVVGIDVNAIGVGFLLSVNEPRNNVASLTTRFRIDCGVLEQLRDEVIDFWSSRDMTLTGSRFGSVQVQVTLPDGMGFSKLPVSSMLGCLSPQTPFHGGNRHGLSGYFVDLGHAMCSHFRYDSASLASSGNFMFLVRPSSWRLSRGETWPSRCSPGR